MVEGAQGEKSGSGPLIITNTSQYPTDEVRKLVRFALKGTPRNRELEVHVKGSTGVQYAVAGTFYGIIPSVANVKLNRNYLIVVRVGSRDKFPFKSQYWGHKRCEKYACTLKNWMEGLVHITAHEGEHLRQNVTGKRAREDHAERRAFKTLLKFRARGGD